jgi:hypothetical protein
MAIPAYICRPIVCDSAGMTVNVLFLFVENKSWKGEEEKNGKIMNRGGNDFKLQGFHGGGITKRIDAMFSFLISYSFLNCITSPV